MPYYDRIASQWNKSTGYKGGAFKEHSLNEVLLAQIGVIQGTSILELGAGNGYFMPMVLERFSGQTPEKVCITDISEKILTIAKRMHCVRGADYQKLDIRSIFPFSDENFDLIICSMVLNELGIQGLRTALHESYRVLRREGQSIVAVTHPAFVADLQTRGQLRRERGILTMPGASSLRVPITIRSVDQYREAVLEAGYEYTEIEVHPTEQVLNAKPGLRQGKRVPIALVFRCVKR